MHIQRIIPPPILKCFVSSKIFAAIKDKGAFAEMDNRFRTTLFSAYLQLYTLRLLSLLP